MSTIFVLRLEDIIGLTIVGLVAMFFGVLGILHLAGKAQRKFRSWRSR